MQLGAGRILGNGFIPMIPASPRALAANAGLAFVGETPWSPAVVTPTQVRALEAARNPSGRPNSDVLRQYVGCESGRQRGHRQIDFPPHFTPQEAALYLKPWQQLRQRLNAMPGTWWHNPHAQAGLRTALSRLERYLATPRCAPVPAWEWIDSNLLPADSLLVVARDDDFTQGLLRSRLFLLWWRRHAAIISPESIVASFPFPWPPATLLSALTRTQEEQRLTLARAARGDDREQLNVTAAVAYGWPADLPDDELLTQLAALNRQRAPARL
jgi:hypothetical protein